MIVGSDEINVVHPDGVQHNLGEWRVCPSNDLESNRRELKSALSLMTESIGEHLGARRVKTFGITKVGIPKNAENEFFL